MRSLNPDVRVAQVGEKLAVTVLRRSSTESVGVTLEARED